MKPQWYHPRRAAWIIGGVGLACLLLLVRVIHIQTFARDYYMECSPQSSKRGNDPNAGRGRILDRTYRVLAETVAATTVFASPDDIQAWAAKKSGRSGEKLSTFELQNNSYLRLAARAVAAHLNLPLEEVLGKLCESGVYTPLAWRANAVRAEELRALGIPGIHFETTSRREYPFNTLASAVIGYCNSDQQPVAGAEWRYRQVLEGEVPGSGERYSALAKRLLGRRISGPRAANPGKDLVLAIDLGTQQVADRALDDCYTLRRPAGANVVVMSAHDGSVLAMSCRPTFNPNHISKARPAGVSMEMGALTNRPVSKPMDPGSSLKLLTVAAGLDYGVIDEHSVFSCSGSEVLGGKPPVGCWGKWRTQGHGSLTPAGILSQSCNIGAGKIALRLGPKRMCSFLRRCGVGELPHAGFPVEKAGTLRSPESMRPRDLASIGFGQGLLVSDLQLTSAVCAILNGGVMYRPHIVSGALTPQTGEFYEVKPRAVRRVCSPRTSEIMRRLVWGVVENGTGKRAQIPGFAVGGKTATAQIWDPDTKRWLSGSQDYLMGFVLVAPVDRRPDFVITVTVERPQVGEHGSEVAAPIARAIAEHLLRQPGFFPEWPAEGAADGIDPSGDAV